MKSAGGTELQLKLLKKHVDLSIYKNINIIINNASFESIKLDKKNILWCHHYIDQPSIKLLENRELINKLDTIVFVSNWQKDQFIKKFNIPSNKTKVIKNAVEIEKQFFSKKNKKIKLVYTTTPWRGLEVLLNSIDYLNNLRDDFELEIYSSTIIYGDKFHQENEKYFEKLFKRASLTKNVSYKGYVQNYEILKILEKIDIFTYPSTFIETFCISALEAFCKGCLVFTTNNGALKELGENYAQFIEFNNDLNKLSINYAKKLNILIDDYKNGKFKEKLKDQVKYYTINYSWKKRSDEWKFFLNNFK